MLAAEAEELLEVVGIPHLVEILQVLLVLEVVVEALEVAQLVQEAIYIFQLIKQL
jgi:hypothetical protein